MRPAEKKIHNILQNINEQTRPELDRKILDDCINEMEKQVLTPTGPNMWSLIMKNPITRYAAVLLIIAALSSIFLFSNFTSEAIAFEEVIEAMKNIKWLYQSSKGFQGDISGTAEQWLGFEAKVHAGKWADGKRTFYDIGKEIRYEYDPQNNIIVVTNASGTEIPFSITSPTAMVESMHTMLVQQDAEVTIESTVYSGKKAQLQQFLINVNDQKQCLKLYINPKSKLLIAAELTASDATGKTVMAGDMTFSYPATGPCSIYDLGVPKDTPVRADSMSNQNGIENEVEKIDGLESWPEPVELVQKYWDARSRKDYETTRLYWPNSEQWDKKTFEQEKPIEYVFGEPKIISDVDLYIPYDIRDHYEQTQKYRFKMMLSSIHSKKKRYYIVSGN